MQTGSLAAKYTKMAEDRRVYLDRARDCSELTLPALIPSEAFGRHDDLYQPFQSVGARGVNNLASKLLLLLLPPNQPFFRLSLDAGTEREMSEQAGVKAEVEKSLAEYERSVTKEIENKALRPSIWEALKHLIVSGNVCLFFPPEGGVRVFALNQFVVQRAPDGSILKMITKEVVARQSLPEDHPEYKLEATDDVDVYTCIYRTGDKYYVHQEAGGVLVEGSEGEYPLELLPWIHLRMISVDHESYGRSFVDEYLGDLTSLEGLMRAMVESAAASSKVVFLVKPNATTRKKDLASAENGAVITGSPDDVHSLQTEKFNDMRVVMEAVGRIEERLSYAFLLHEAVQRDAERVTATEIRYLQEQIEGALGGVYSVLSQELQLPLVNQIMDRLTKERKLPKLPKENVTPVIITGVEALGRGHDLNKLRGFLQDVMSLAQINPETIQRVEFGDLIKRLGTGHGIDMNGLIKSEEQIQEEQQMMQQQAMQQQMMDAAQQSAPGVAREVAKNSAPTQQ
tara:strand:+ start:233 stop:1768 length:1536 start_codon:yes stop_codon:yes gene_type:complete